MGLFSSHKYHAVTREHVATMECDNKGECKKCRDYSLETAAKSNFKIGSERLVYACFVPYYGVGGVFVCVSACLFECVHVILPVSHYPRCLCVFLFGRTSICVQVHASVRACARACVAFICILHDFVCCICVCVCVHVRVCKWAERLHKYDSNVHAVRNIADIRTTTYVDCCLT